MKNEIYPPAEFVHLVRRVLGDDAGNIHRDWTGNDKSARNHNSPVALNESPLRLRLSWKSGPEDTPREVGVYDLDLRQLLREGFVREEPNSDEKVRLRFYHREDGVIVIQVNSKTPALPVGRTW